MSKAASAVARKRAMAGQARVLARGVRLYVEGGNPRRTPLIGKIAICGWKLAISGTETVPHAFLLLHALPCNKCERFKAWQSF
jgi:hypothetical protein